MFAACLFTMLLEHPMALAHAWVPEPAVRRVLMGVAMGAIVLTFGLRSKAHYNPAMTFTFWLMGRVKAMDAFLRVLFQFVGGVAGTALARAVLGAAVEDSSVNYAATLPGPDGPWAAFAAEAFISFLLMTAILYLSRSVELQRYIPFAAGALVAVFITFEAPFSGMSMNPARTFASAVLAGEPLWPFVYFIAPVAGMAAAAAIQGALHD